MAFDSTIGGENSNSYSDVAAADEYFATNLAGESWQGLSDIQKQSYLVQATLMIDDFVDWTSLPSSESQSLHWPAVGATDRSGRSHPDNIIPKDIQRATCEQAVYLMEVNSTNNPAAISQGIKSAKADVLEVEFDKSAIPDRLGATVEAILSCYGKTRGKGNALSQSVVGSA